MPRLRPVVLLAALHIAMIAVCPATVRADEAQDVERLLRAGRASEALARVERSLAARPADPQLRFLKGVVLADARRTAEATEVLVKLTEDHPDLAEPYNNLAVIYAGDGRYDKARDALEAAVRANPGYATAHENLGDVYVRLAAASYQRALRLDAANRSAVPKLVLVRGLFSTASAAPATAGSAPR